MMMLSRPLWLVFRRSAVRVTTMPEGNDREHDGHRRQGHSFGGEDAPARRSWGDRSDTDATLGLETMCVGGGQGMAIIFERLN